MSVSKIITRLEHSAVKATITVEKADVRAHYEELVKDYVKNLQIPGFRKGKVPREVLERKFGSVLKDETLNKIFGKTVTEIFEDENFSKEDRPLPYSTPRLEDEPVLDFDRDLTFSVVYDVMPSVTVGLWKGLELEVPDVVIGDEDLNRELDGIRERNAVVMDRNDGESAAKTDVVTVNYCELDSGKNPIKGSERQDFVFTLGSGYNLYEFDNDITGMKKGETRDITKTYPEDYSRAEYAGKTVTVRVTLTALKEKKLPDLDDDLAQDVDEKFATLEDLKNSVRGKLAKNLEKQMKKIAVSGLLEQIMKTTTADIPESMIKIELDARWRNLARNFNVSPDALERDMINAGNDPEKIRDDWKGDAEKALKSRLIIETLMRDLKLEVSSEEIEKELEASAAASNMPLEDIKKYYEQENAREFLEEDIKERKLFDIILAENKITKGKKTKYADLMSNNGLV